MDGFRLRAVTEVGRPVWTQVNFYRQRLDETKSAPADPQVFTSIPAQKAAPQVDLTPRRGYGPMLERPRHVEKHDARHVTGENAQQAAVGRPRDFIARIGVT